jgi:ATP-dependent Clp protease ATP-binding subunit ClpC
MAAFAARYNRLSGGGVSAMNKDIIRLDTRRANEARSSRYLNATAYRILIVLSIGLIIGAVALAVFGFKRYALLLTSPALLCLVPALWWKQYLSVLPPSGKEISDRMAADVLAGLKRGAAQTPASLWAAVASHWQTRFILAHLLLDGPTVGNQLEQTPGDLAQAVSIATQLADQNKSALIEPGFIAASLMLTSPGVVKLLVGHKSGPEDLVSVANWLGRNLTTESLKSKSGGLGRDWAFGYTPLLDKLGTNISRAIAKYGTHFGWLTQSDGVKAMEAALDNKAKAIALIGNVGIGKSSSVYALAQRLIEGQTSRRLAYHQIIGVNATDIMSASSAGPQLARIMLSLANEASHSGNVILFLDDAQLFFSDKPGAFDGSQILLSIVQSRSVPIILALTPNDYQRLKSSNASLAGLLTPVVLQELPKAEVLRVLEDTALNFESQHKVLVSYSALTEAYNLSGRYNQDEAYPGRAIKLVEQAISYASGSVVDNQSVQKAVEQMYGVKVGTAEPTEASALLNLEDKIHERMVDQTQAVSAVANSLRRARAGVTNPNRPIGSFLFLGPTGVGKTELAKSLATVYFGNEKNMIRLDMSEYQSPQDVGRLLSDGETDSKSLTMSLREQPFSVVLLDEIEKAHANILNLLLQLLDEGQLTDSKGRSVSFKDCIVIATSNAGAQTIREHVESGADIADFQAKFVDSLINSGQFKPELINRFDEVVLFGPLKPEDLVQVVSLMLGEVNRTLANQNISVRLTDAAITRIVQVGYDPRLGARPMRRMLQKAVEDVVAQRILKGEAKPGDQLRLDESDLNLVTQ